jgi:hypothetical protein
VFWNDTELTLEEAVAYRISVVLSNEIEVEEKGILSYYPILSYPILIISLYKSLYSQYLEEMDQRNFLRI